MPLLLRDEFAALMYEEYIQPHVCGMYATNALNSSALGGRGERSIRKEMSELLFLKVSHCTWDH